MTNASSSHKVHIFPTFYEFALKLSAMWFPLESFDSQICWTALKRYYRFFRLKPFDRICICVRACVCLCVVGSYVCVCVLTVWCRTVANVFPLRESCFSPCFRDGIGSSYVDTDRPAYTHTHTQSMRYKYIYYIAVQTLYYRKSE